MRELIEWFKYVYLNYQWLRRRSVDFSTWLETYADEINLVLSEQGIWSEYDPRGNYEEDYQERLYDQWVRTGEIMAC